jgi:hypothetical protein
MTGHAKVQDQPVAVVQLHEEVLAVAPGGLEGRTFESGLQFLGGDAFKNLAAAPLGLFDLLM